MAQVHDSKLQRLRQWRAGETPGPYEIILFPTNRCNLKCQICWEREAEVNTDGAIYNREYEIPDERLLRLVDEAAELGVQWWSFIGGGEPMLRGPVVLEMFSRIRARGMNGVLHTNGTTFKPGNLERLIELGWQDMTVSLDGPTPEINDAIRFKHCFTRADKHLTRLSALKGGDRRVHPHLALNVTMTNTNIDKLHQMVELADRLGCVRIGFSRLIVDSYSEAFATTPQQEARLPDYMLRARETAERLGIQHNCDAFLPSGPGNGAHGCARTQHSGWTDAACYEVWLTATIVADGKVGPCCVFYDEAAQNVREHDLHDIWLGPYFQDIRARIGTDNLMHYCPNCPSNIVQRSADLRAHVAREQQGLGQRVHYLGGRFGQHLRRNGLRKTIGRTWEYVASRMS